MARKLISHLLVTLDGAVKFGSARDVIVKPRDREVMDDFAAELSKTTKKGVVILSYRP